MKKKWQNFHSVILTVASSENFQFKSISSLLHSQQNLTHQKCLIPSTVSVREDFINKTNRFARRSTVKYYICHFEINGCHHTKYEVKILFNGPLKPNFMTISHFALSRTVNNMQQIRRRRTSERMKSKQNHFDWSVKV